ncbi:hypothetical protein [Pyrococcus abyssi]|nr:hypothetical protein [Pyrococcus abyssi]CCE70521.1 TPA: hypothetical protein PAB0733 [Pyrococcus abyssi GE5]
MEVFEIKLKVPYDKKGAIIKKLANVVRGKAKLLPPDYYGFSRIIVEGDKNSIKELIKQVEIRKVKISSH